MIKMYSDKELWRENYASSIIQSKPYLKISNISHFSWDRSKARALLFWYTGALKFKTLWKLYNVQRGVGINCLFLFCPGNDDLNHVQNCQFYHTRWKREWTDDKDITNYLVKLNRECTERFKMPLF